MWLVNHMQYNTYTIETCGKGPGKRPTLFIPSPTRFPVNMKLIVRSRKIFVPIIVYQVYGTLSEFHMSNAKKHISLTRL